VLLGFWLLTKPEEWEAKRHFDVPAQLDDAATEASPAAACFAGSKSGVAYRRLVGSSSPPPTGSSGTPTPRSSTSPSRIRRVPRLRSVPCVGPVTWVQLGRGPAARPLAHSLAADSGRL